jgi:LacI family transcriptional regulator
MTSGSKKRVTLIEIAELAGVSRSAVGHVLNGRGDKLRIAAETQEKVRKIAREKGYLSNFAVKQLRSSKTYQVAYVMTTALSSNSILNPFALSMIKDLQLNDYQTLIIDVDMKSLEISPLFQSRRFDGIVIEGVVPNQDFLEEWCKKFDVPYVYLNHEDKEKNHAGIDEKGTAEMLVEKLCGLGYRKMAYYFPRTLNSNPLFREDHIFKRELFIRQAMKKRGLKLYPNTVEQRSHGENTAKYLMELPDPPDCIIGYDIFHGISFKRFATQMGLSVPEDVGLVVFSMDKFNVAANICGIDFDYSGIGKALAKMILKRVKDGRDRKANLIPGAFADSYGGIKFNSLKNL